MKKTIFFIKRNPMTDKIFEALRKRSEIKVADVKKFARSEIYNSILKDVREINKMAKVHIPEIELFTQKVREGKNGRPYKVLSKHPNVKITATGSYYIIEAHHAPAKKKT